MPAFSRLLADDRPDETALVHGERTFGWAEVDSILNRVAGLVLSADLGPARRAAVFAENAAETAFAHLGGLLGGASTVPVSFHLTAAEAAYILEESESRILFVGPETARRGVGAARGTGVETIVGWGEGLPAEVVRWDRWMAAGPDTDPPGDVAPRPHLMFTSGTTGRPKGTDLPPTMFAGGATMIEHLEALKGSRWADYGTHLVVGPMYHTGPLSGLRTLVAGVPTVILGRFDAEATLAAIERHRVETAIMVPTHFVRLLALPDAVRDRYGKGFPTHLVKRTRAMLSAMNAAAVLGDLRFPPGNRLEELKGDRAGQHSIRINDQWRICFVWTDLGPADVEIVDYH